MRAFVVLAISLLSLSSARAQTPPPEAFDVRITPDERTARRGEVMAFMVEVVNTSTVDLLRDGPSGGTALLMKLPAGFGFVNGSGTIDLGSGQSVPALDPAAARAEPRLVQDRDGSPLTLNLGAGQGLRFRFQIRTLPMAKPYSEGTLRAWLTTADATRLTNDAVARLRVEPDPEFDLAVVLGSVYCDTDGDGARDAGEDGVGGVRIAADTGRVVDSDREGRYHLRDFRAGAHLVKLDANTLPPGATLTTPAKKLIDLTGGLIVEHSFGVRCKHNLQSPGELWLAGSDAPSNVIDAASVTVRGNANDLALAWDGFAAPARRAKLALESELMTKEGKRARVTALNVPWRPGPLTRTLTFHLGLEGAPVDAKVAQWSVEIATVGAGRELVRVFNGKGAPPPTLLWEGLDPDGAVGVLRRGVLHEARLIIVEAGERLESAPVLIGASWRAEGTVSEVARTVHRDGLLNKAEEPSGKLMALLKRAKDKVEKTPGARLLVEVHSDPSGAEDADLIKTRRAAFNIGLYARKTLGLTSDRFFAMGFGSTRPLRPNVTKRNRAFNKRIEIVVLPPEDERKLAAPPLAPGPPRAFVQGVEAVVDQSGAFLATVPRAPGEEAVAVSVQSADGARRTLVRGIIAAPTKRPGVDEGGALIVPVPGKETTPEPGEKAPEAAPPEIKAGDIARDPLRRFGGQPLREAIGPGALVVGDDHGPTRLSADDLEIDLPPRGAVLKSPRLFLAGRTDPRNRVTVNDQALVVDRAGRFGDLVTLASDTTALRIVSRDPAGNEARLSWPVTVKDTELFLLALVDGVGGMAGARIEERDSYELETHDDSLFVAGRGALYVKGRISGNKIVKDLFVTAHVDSARKNDFAPFFDQVIDPTRDYLIYGDATDDQRDANTRGPLYLLVEADRSKLVWGSFRTDVRGVHLLRYDRTFDGAKLDLDHDLAKGFRTRLKGYVTDDNRRLVRRHDELRATGGSIYYMSSKEILEGSDKVELVVRELDTQLELGRATLTRDLHYRIDYASGRITTMGPISSVIDPFFQIAGFQPFTGRSVLDGHEVWLDVDYEARAVRSAGDLAWGVQAKQQLFDRVEIGGGIVREGRPAGSAGSDEDYVLWGVHAKVELSEKSRVYGEYAQNRDKDGATRVSLDGGIGYRDLDRSPDSDGYALVLGLDTDIGELFSVADLDLQVKAHWQLVTAGYHAVGLAAEEGTEKWGGEVAWSPVADGRVHLRYDGGTTLVQDASGPVFTAGERAVVRNRWLGRYEHRVWRGTVYGEIGFGQHRDALDGVVHDTGALAVGTSLRLLPKLRLLASQEALFGGDNGLLGRNTTDRLTTNVGVELELSDGLALRFGESLRWNGDNATRLGLVTRLGEDSRAYFEERIQPGDRNGRVVGTTVIGAEHALGRSLQDGRIYSEYRLDGGVGGRTNRAVMGLGRTFELQPGIKVMIAYERSQVIDAPEGDPSRGTRDVLSGGLQLANVDWLRLGSLYEMRWDRDLPSGQYREVLQAVTRNALDVTLGHVTLFGLFNYVLSQDLDTRRVAKEDMEASFGLAFRPLEDDDLVLIAKYSRLTAREATTVVSLLGEALFLDEKRVSDLVSLAAVIDLPLRLTLTEKLVWRIAGTETSGFVAGDEDLLLWLSRLAFDIWGDLSLAGEFRLFASLNDGEIRRNGGLLELSYEFYGYARLGLGWAIDGNSGGLLPGEEGNDIDNGFYVRMTGMY